jgi:twitching motility protein PilT
MNTSVPTTTNDQTTVKSAQVSQKPVLQNARTVQAEPGLTPEIFHAILGRMLAVDPKVSDLIFSPGRPPQVELTSDLFAVVATGIEKLTPPMIKAIADLMLTGNKTGQDALEKYGSTDISYSAPSLARFRVNIFMQRGTHAIVMRVIPGRVPNWQELNLPMAVRNVAELKNGLVLVTGPTGSGKSTTLAAVIDLINTTKKYHVVTIEDPIEFLHDHKLSTIHQRELHSDTPDFALALRAALRQAPKVILVGEMRDRETIEVAMEASENRPPGVIDFAHDRRGKDDRPDHRCVSEERRTCDQDAPFAVFQTHHLAASDPKDRRRTDRGN